MTLWSSKPQTLRVLWGLKYESVSNRELINELLVMVLSDDDKEDENENEEKEYWLFEK